MDSNEDLNKAIDDVMMNMDDIAANASQDRVDDIKRRFEAFRDSGVSWRITIANPYAHSSTIMQERGSHPEKVMGDFLNNLVPDVEFLLSKAKSACSSID